jgi:hypothetical protein
MIFAIGDANPRAPIGSSVHGGTEGSNPASSSGESTNFRFLRPVALAEAVPMIAVGRR